MLYLNREFATIIALAMTATCELYTLRLSLPGNVLDGQVINAQGRALYTGLSSPSTYCPSIVNPYCPKNHKSRTVFVGIIGIYVMVPGGQQIYIGSDGAIGITQAHSGFIPTGSYRGGWIKITSNTSPSRNLITWESPDKSTGGVYACLVSEGSAIKRAVYQIYTKTPAFTRTKCVKLDGLDPMYLPDSTPIEVWQYI